MPKAKDARADKAFAMYKQGLKLIEIANQLGIAEGTVRSWKNRYKWDDDGNATLRKKEKKECNVAKKIATQTNDASWVEIEHEYVTDISSKRTIHYTPLGVRAHRARSATRHMASMRTVLA